MDTGPIYCRITVRGRIAPYLSPWLGELQPAHRVTGEGVQVTELTGTVVDESALQGLLHRIWNLNLAVLSVSTSTRSCAEDNPPEDGDEHAPE